MEPECKRKKGAEHDDLDSWDVLPVLSDEQSQDVKLLDAYAAPIVEKRETSRLIRDLSGIYPLPNLQHLKRVRARRDEGCAQRLEVIVCLLSDVHDLLTLPEPPSIKDLLGGRDFNSAGLGDPFVVRVPAGPPLTRPQFERASTHWPTSFHEDKRITCALTGRLFSSNQKARMREYMTTAVQAAELARGRGMDAVGAVMVDPRTDQILAVGHDLRRGTHPLQHAVMVCIDLVACRQGGGAYGYEEYPGCTYSVPATDGEGTPQEYICTGYDLYVTREPCAMCAMALLHSRIGRVFYGVASPDGALGTKYKIHCQKDLNHHFDVYKGVMLQSCEGLRGPK